MMRTQQCTISRTTLMALVLASVLALMGIGTGQAYALGVGDTFKHSGNTYKVSEIGEGGNDLSEVILVKYGSNNLKPVINTVTYKGERFEVDIIGKNAFNNAKGHKIVKVTLGEHVDKIWAKAFYGCKKLRVIDMTDCDAVDIDKNKRGKYYLDELDIKSQAFTKAGVKGVKVKCGKANASYQKIFKKALKSKGLRSDAKIAK